MKYALLLLLLVFNAPVYASGGTMLGMIFTVAFVVILLGVFLLVVLEIGEKKKPDQRR